ncbi:MAG TPA: GNAT family N-acetyltransferase [Rhodobacter sp.]|nr:GNAT family N-acetyltransferase [Rhodobacter sp.]
MAQTLRPRHPYNQGHHPPMLIRPLHPDTDRATVTAFFDSIADYIRMERDAPPDATVIEEFFTDTPPGCDPTHSLRLGLFEHSTLIALAEMGFGYPESDNAYLGFLAVSEMARGKGAGEILFAHLETEARARGCSAIYLAVLDANPRGRAFWERQGFTLAIANREVTLGQKTQIAHRLRKPL